MIKVIWKQILDKKKNTKSKYIYNMKEENHDIVYMYDLCLYIVNAYNWRDGANNHKKIYIMKIYKD